MIKLYQFIPAWNLPNVSPFCMKVETYLRMAGLPYDALNGASPVKAPKKKLPYIDDNGKIVTDSGFIVAYLKQIYGDKLDGRLSPADQTSAHLLRRVCEESLYWVIVYSRWMEESIWQVVRANFFANLPPVVKQILPMLIKRSVVK